MKKLFAAFTAAMLTASLIAVFTVNTAAFRPAVALTFDDGPAPGVTERIVEALLRHGAKATFFMVGEMVEKHPETARAVAEAGFEIGNHTYDHKNLKCLSAAEIKEELSKTAAAVKEATGMTVFAARAPGGNINERVRALFEGFDVVGWTVDTKDWRDRDAEKLTEFIRRAPLKDGDIILMHDIRPTTADAVDEILTILEARGFDLVTVSELAARKERD